MNSELDHNTSIFDKIESIQDDPYKFIPLKDLGNVKYEESNILKDDEVFFLSPFNGILKKRRTLLTLQHIIIYSVRFFRQKIPKLQKSITE